MALDKDLEKQLLDLIDRQDARIEELEASVSEPVAIIGMSCRLPGKVTDLRAFWRMLNDGIDGTEEVPLERWNAESIYSDNPDDPGTSYCKRGGFLHDIDQFDADFFSISGKEANALDPQQRVLLELAWESIEHAGILPATLAETPVGVFIGSTGSGYPVTTAGLSLSNLDGYVGTGSSGSTASGRIAFALGLRGPAVTIDTACSSSLVALHNACLALRNGDCSMALVGGCSISFGPQAFVEFCRLRGMAQDGRCKAFAQTADGVGWSDGAGMLLVKPLRRAQADGDQILAVIRSSAVNQDGPSAGLTVPNGPAQQDVVHRAMDAAGLGIEDIDYIEAHGTGTRLGDPVEANALSQVFKHRQAPLYLGSVKSNVGHTVAAAGVVSIIKTVLAMQHKTLPPTLHADVPSQRIDWINSPLLLVHEAIPWASDSGVRRAGISSFGISGTNVHAILESVEEPVDLPAVETPSEGIVLVPVSAADEDALQSQQHRLARFISEEHSRVTDVAYTQALHRTHFRHRSVWLTQSADGAGLKKPKTVVSKRSISEPLLAAFLFTGQGSQLCEMGRGLYGREAVFTATLDQMADLFSRHIDQPLLELLFAKDHDVLSQSIHQTGYTQPLLFALEFALAKQWMSWGIKPAYVCGHSIGELAAACIAEALAVEDAIRLVAARGRLMQTLPSGGAMLSVQSDASTVSAALEPYPESVSIAAINGPNQTVVSGEVSVIESLHEEWKEAGIKCKRLEVSHAFHSPLMRPIIEDFKSVVGSIEQKPLSIPLISNMEGRYFASGETLPADHWVKHILAPVDFYAALRQLDQKRVNTFIEIGPQPVLLGMAADVSTSGLFIASMDKEQHDQVTLLAALATWYVHGGDIDWAAVQQIDGAHSQRIELPTTAFSRKRYWLDSFSADLAGIDQVPTDNELLGIYQSLANCDVFTAYLSLKQQRWIEEHRILDQALLPGMGLLKMTIDAMVWLGKSSAQYYQISDFMISAPLVVSSEPVLIETIVDAIDDNLKRVSVYSCRHHGEDRQWTLHSQASISPLRELSTALAVRPKTGEPIDVSNFYSVSSAAGYDFGRRFQGLREAFRSGESTWARIAPEVMAQEPSQRGWQVAMLDSALHACRFFFDAEEASDLVYLPWLIDSIEISSKGAGEYWVKITRQQTTDATELIGFDLAFIDMDGRSLGQFSGYQMKPLDAGNMVSAISPRQESWFEVIWEPYVPAQEMPWVDDDETVYSDLVTMDESLLDQMAPDNLLCVSVPEQRDTDDAMRLYRAALLLFKRLVVAQNRPTVVIHTRNCFGADASGLMRGIGAMARSVRAENPDIRLNVLDTGDIAVDDLELCLGRIGNDSYDFDWRWESNQLLVRRLAASESTEDTHRLRDDGPILITGGLGAIGLHFARTLTTHYGVNDLVLVTRRGLAHPKAVDVAREFREQGVRVEIQACDVSDSRQVESLLLQFSEHRPLRGIIHTAGVLDDSLVADANDNSLQHIFAAKVFGALHLSEATWNWDMDLFVLCSSFAATAGNAGQSLYAAANEILESIADYRQLNGLPAIAVAWGFWDSADSDLTAGIADADRRRFESRGVRLITAELADELVKKAIDDVSANRVAIPLDFRRLAQAHGRERLSLFEHFIPRDTATKSGMSGIEHILDLPENARERALCAWVHEIVTDELATQVDDRRPLKEHGMDSLLAVNIRNRIAKLMDESLPASLLFDYPTVEGLAGHLLSLLVGSQKIAPSIVAQVSDSSDAIAIVGLACRYPGGSDSPERFWSMFEEGRDAVTAVPPERWDTAAIYAEDNSRPGTSYCTEGGFIKDVDLFDASFFGINKHEADTLDPQQRILLELSWEALERAMIPVDSLQGEPVGVFIGYMGSDYLYRTDLTSLSILDGYVGTGVAGSTISGRISYSLGFTGPCMTIDTACSSSLVSIHQASSALRNGECDIALAGGANVILTPRVFVEFCRQGGMAKDGRCKSFSDAADGAGWAEGAGMLVLKRLSDAERDGDNILAVVRSSAVNQDGRSAGLTVPNGPSQQRVIRQALANAGLGIDDIDYIEAHGTGTTLGDPIEAGALMEVFKDRKNALFVGSSKSNIAHTMAAAGVGGVIKTVLALQHKTLPKTLHADKPSEKIEWQNNLLSLVQYTQAWECSSDRRRAGVSAFGISGTNAHVIIEEAPERPETPISTSTQLEPGSLDILCLSARSQSALPLQKNTLARYIRDNGDLDRPDIAYSLATCRSHFRYRAAWLVNGYDTDLASQTYLVSKGDYQVDKAAFLFTGQGSQLAGMGRSLYRVESVFTETLDRCVDAFAAHLDIPLLDLMFCEPGSEQEQYIHQTQYTQPLLFSLGYSLACQWLEWGVSSGCVLGHSIGEITAACVAGAMSFGDAVSLVAARGRLMQALPAGGSMTSVLASAEALADYLVSASEKVVVAGFNSPGQTVLSGAIDVLEDIEHKLKQDGIKFKRLSVSHAFHSPLMQPMLDTFREVAEGIHYRPLEIPLVSNMDGYEYAIGTLLTAEHWVDHVLAPVNFMGSIGHVEEMGIRCFVEIGPQPVLTAMAAETLSHESLMLPSFDKNQDSQTVLISLASWYVHGGQVDWQAFYKGRSLRKVQLPVYAFDRQRYWFSEDLPTSAGVGQCATEDQLLGMHQVQALADVFTNRLSLKSHPWLDQHRIGGHALMPAMGMLNMCLRAAAYLQAARYDTLLVKDFTVFSPLRVTEENLTVQLMIEGDGVLNTVTLFSSRDPSDRASAWTKHCQTVIGDVIADQTVPAVNLPQFDEMESLNTDDMYRLLADAGYDYGQMFQGVKQAWRGDAEVWTEVVLSPDANDGTTGWHSALLDSLLHTCHFVFSEGGDVEDSNIYLPWSIDTVEMDVKGLDHVLVRCEHVVAEDIRDQVVTFDLSIYSMDGEAIGKISGFRLKAVDRQNLAQSVAGEVSLHHCVFELDWRSLDSLEPVTNANVPDLPVIHTEANVLFDISRSGTDREVWDPNSIVVIHFSDISRDAIELYQCVLALTQHLVDLAEAPWVVLQTHHALDGPNTTIQSGIAGFIRSVRNESASQRFMTLAVTEEAGSPSEIIYQNMVSQPHEPEWCWDGIGLSRPRIRPLPELHETKTMRRDGTYLITGGLGAIGRTFLSVLHHEYGIADFVLVSRRGENHPRAKALIDEYREMNVNIDVVGLDISNADAVKNLITSIGDKPLRGIVHAAGLLADRIIHNLADSDVETVLSAKVKGALNLHEFSKQLDLDTFILCSSFAGITGNAGQSLYAAANRILDNIARMRHTAGQAGQSIAWGLWSDDTSEITRGVAIDAQQKMLSTGFPPIDHELASALVRHCLTRTEPFIVAAPMNRQRLIRNHIAEQQTLFADFAGVSEQTSAIDEASDFNTLLAEEKPDALRDLIRGTISSVLGVSVDDDRSLNEFGMDSLMGVEIRNRLVKATGWSLPATLLFKVNTVNDLVTELSGNLDVDDQVLDLSASGSLAPVDSAQNDELLLSDGQKRIWYLDRLDAAKGQYNLHVSADINKPLNIGLLSTVLTLLMSQNEALRTIYADDEGAPRVQLLGGWMVDLALNDFSDVSEDKREACVDEFIVQESQKGFDLAEGPLIRFTLCKLSDEHYRFAVTVHHINSDGISIVSLLYQIISGYEAFSFGQALPQVVEAKSYQSFCRWQAEQIGTPEWLASKQYWRDTLEGVDWIDLCGQRPRPEHLSGRGDAIVMELSARLVSQVDRFAKTSAVTPNVVYLAVYSLLLKHYSVSAGDNLIATAVSARPMGWESTQGFFANTLPLRCSASLVMTINEHLQSVNRTMLGALDHQFYPFGNIVGDLMDDRSAMDNPFYRVGYAYEGLAGGELPVGWVPRLDMGGGGPQDRSQGEISLIVTPAADLISACWIYSTDIFDHAFIAKMAEQYICLLQDYVAGDLGGTLGDLHWCSDSAYQSLLGRGDGGSAQNNATSLVELFQKQVDTNPHKCALVTAAEKLNYSALDQMADAVAASVIAETGYRDRLAPDTLVLLVMDPGITMIAAMLGIMKAGGAYVPVSIKYPPQRLRYIIEDSGSSILITDTTAAEHITPIVNEFDLSIQVCVVSHSLLSAAAQQMPRSFLPASSDLAYVIYTSGSTGQPKGVMVEHKSAVNLVCAESEAMRFSADETIIQLSDVVFDASVEQIWLALANGLCLSLPSRDSILNVEEIADMIESQNVSHVDATPEYLLQLLDVLRERGVSLKRVLSGGDRFRSDIATNTVAETTFNAYGPSEVTVTATRFCCTGAPEVSQIIGRPLQNLHVYILNDALKLVPDGAPGELCISGVQVARGYINAETLTAERFITNPFCAGEGRERLYRTGDLARWTQSGDLEYLGRIDKQLKIRGFRIDPSEVETVILQQDGVTQAVVGTAPDMERPALIAWVVPENERVLNADQLLDAVAQALPAFMIPAHLLLVPAIPLNLSGKVDTAQLPLPEQTQSLAKAISDDEKTMSAVWSRVLNTVDIGLDDNFFALGGDSILAMQLVSAARRHGFELRVQDVFAAPTVARLLARSKKSSGINNIIAESGELQGTVPLLPIQKHFFEQPYAVPNHFNQAFAIGIPASIGASTLVDMLNDLAVQHDMLRVLFSDDNSEGWHGTYGCPVSQTQAPLVILDASTDTSHEQNENVGRALADLHTRLDYRTGPTWGGIFFKTAGEACHQLLLVFHHLIIDIVSWRILKDDLEIITTAYDDSPKRLLLPKATSYRQWAQWISQYEDNHPDQAEYWLALSEQSQATLDCYPSAERVRVHRTVHLAPQDTEKLLNAVGPLTDCTLNEFLLAALARALKNTFGGNAHCVTLEGHGRETGDTQMDLSRTVGWFTTLYPVLLTASDDLILSLIENKQHLRKIPDQGIGFGVIAKHGRSLPLSPVRFNYMGQFTETEASEGGDRVWQFLDVDCGKFSSHENTDGCLLDINAVVRSDGIAISVDAAMSDTGIDNFSEALSAALVDVAAILSPRHAPVISTPDELGIEAAHTAELAQRLRKPDIHMLLPVTPLQAGLISHELRDLDTVVYQPQLLLGFNEELDIERFKVAWQTTISQHPALRIAFDWHFSYPIQQLYREVLLDSEHWQVLDIEGLSSDDQSEFVRRYQLQARQSRFNLEKPGLFKITIFKYGIGRYGILLTMHHIIADGWSLPLLWQTIWMAYGGKDEMQPVSRALQVYRESMTEIRRLAVLHQRYWSESREGWSELTGASDLSGRNLNLVDADALVGNQSHQFQLDTKLAASLKTWCSDAGVTLSAVLQFCWHKILQSYSGAGRTIAGVTVAGREIDVNGVETCVGLFINTLPLVVDWEGDLTVEEQIHSIQRSVADISANSCVSLSDLEPDGRQLFDTVVVFENYPLSDSSGDLTDIVTVENAQELSQFPLALQVFPDERGLRIELIYSESAFDTDQIEYFAHLINRLLELIPHNEHALPSDLGLVDHDDFQSQLGFGRGNELVVMPHTLHGAFTDQVKVTPTNTALIFEHLKLTYAELDRLSDIVAQQVARELLQGSAIELSKEAPIGVLFDRGVEQVIAVLAVLKLGGCYVPLSPAHPDNRLQYVLEDTQCVLVLADASNRNRIANLCAGNEYGTLVFVLDYNELKTETSVDQNHNLPVISPDDLAYIIYTSGSTGRPKGVMIEHNSVIHLIRSQIAAFDVNQDDVFVWSFNFVFDAGGEILWRALLSGGALVIPTDTAAMNPAAMVCEIVKHGVTEYFGTPEMIENLLPLLDKQTHPLKRLLAGGGRVSSAVASTTIVPEVFNLYGPTEVTVVSTYTPINPLEARQIIGRPVDNLQAYILDSNLNPVPAGAVGELCLAGPQVGRGYLNRVDLTAKCFVENPYDQRRTYDRIYRTGDKVRWLEDGSIEYLGRFDKQVKIRGFRIEPGEIENIIRDVSDIYQALVVVQDLAEASILVAYVVMNLEATFDKEELKASVSRQLPVYMVPNVFVELDAIPLNVNGKVDESALPKPIIEQSDYCAPRSDIEEKYCQLWREILGLERIGIHDNFFSLGGNSIQAMRFMGLCASRFGVHIDVASLFDAPTIAELSRAAPVDVYGSIEPCQRNHYPLSYAQQRLWFIDQYNADSGIYNTSMLWKLHDDVEWEKLASSLKYVIQKHYALNSLVRVSADGQCESILADFEPEIAHRQVDQQALVAFVSTEKTSRFDLVNERPVRLIQIDSELEKYLLIVIHHIAIDAWSLALFLPDVKAHYESQALDLMAPAQMQRECEPHYGDFSVWQHDFIKEHGDELNTYWLKQLEGYELLQLPTDFSRPVDIDYDGHDIAFAFDRPLSDAIKNLAATHNTTSFNVLLSGFYILMSMLSGQRDIVIGTPSDNRGHADTHEIIGCFVNSLVLRACLNYSKSARDLLEQVKTLLVGAKQHEFLPFESIVEMLEVGRNTGMHPVFQVMFAKHVIANQNVDMPFDLVNGDGSSDLNTEARFDLSLYIDDECDEIHGFFNYASSLFMESSVQQWSELYRRILVVIVENIDMPLMNLQLISESERYQLMEEYSCVETACVDETPIVTLFERQVERSPEDIAAVFEGAVLTYRQLNNCANHLAQKLYLARRDAGSQMVVVCLERSLEMIVSLWAVAKAGMAYIPVSPDDPVSRVCDVVDDAKPVAALVSETSMAVFAETKESGMTMISTDAILQAKDDVIANLDIGYRVEDLLYIIYTSGSTGKPKGVMVAQRAVINRLQWQIDRFAFEAGDTFLLKTPFTFDVSVWELFSPFLIGSTLVIAPPQAHRDPETIHRLLCEHQISLVHFVPSMLSAFCAWAIHWQHQLPSSVRQVFCTGEVLSGAIVNQFYVMTDDSVGLNNLYGPTETTVEVTAQENTRDWAARKGVPIGKPINNVQVYVLDTHGNLLPPGIPGELYIGGVCLAEGYLNRNDLTQKSFVRNPFSDHEDSRLYRSGDKVRWLEGGVLEYLGRLDDQIKLRGMRIEVGEIESYILEVPWVAQAAVRLKTRNNVAFLVAYMVAKDPSAFDETALRDYLAQSLPVHMVPTAYVCLDALPVSSSGKLDSRALPLPVINASGYQPAENELQQAICRIWADLLAVEQVGIEDNFFALGGSSINAITMQALCAQRLDVTFELADLFHTPTVRGLAEVMKSAHSRELVHHEREAYPLSFSQQRFWFIQGFSHTRNLYNIPAIWKVQPEAQLDALVEALISVCRHHRPFRQLVDICDDGAAVMVESAQMLEITTRRVPSNNWPQSAINDAWAGFELTQDLPLRLFCYETDAGTFVMLVAHHIAFDGWSLGLLLDEWASAYEMLLQGVSLPLELSGVDYSDYAVWQRSAEGMEALKADAEFWREQLSGYENLRLPTDFERPAQIDYSGRNFNFLIDQDIMSLVRERAAENGVTLYSVLLSAFYASLAVVTGQNNIVIGTPADNRGNPQIRKLIGCLVNTLVLRGQINCGQTPAQLFEQVHDQVGSAKRHEAFPFEKLIDLLNVDRDSSRHPIFQVMFSMDQPDARGQRLPLENRGGLINGKDVAARFDLSLHISQQETTFACCFNYASSLFCEDTIGAWASIFTQILQQFCYQSQCAIQDIQWGNQNDILPDAFSRIGNRGGQGDRSALQYESQTESKKAKTKKGHIYVKPATAEQQFLCHLWQEILGIERVGAKDDFFDLGGDSIVAVQVATRISIEFDIVLPVSAVFTHSVVDKLANEILYLKSFNGEALDRLVTPLTPCDTSKPIMILFHAAYGGSEIYRQLSVALAKDYTCIGIEHYNQFADTPIKNLSELSEIYASVIEKHCRPGEPIHLFGHSMGGNIAFSAANYLREKGVPIARIIMSDSFCNDSEVADYMAQHLIELDTRSLLLDLGLDETSIDYFQDIFESDNEMIEKAQFYPISDIPVFLFKACKTDAPLNEEHDRFNQFLVSKDSNGWRKLTDNSLSVTLFENESHRSIIEAVDKLYRCISAENPGESI